MISEFPLWVFTTLTGTAAGLAIMTVIFPAKDNKRPWILPLVALVLLLVGSVAVIGHLGRPELMLNVLNNPTASLTMEGICAGILIVVMAIDLVLSCVKKKAVAPVRIVELVAGCLVIAVEAYAYLEVFGIPAWSSVSTLPYFVASDLACGATLWMVLSRNTKNQHAFEIATCVIAALAAVCTFWKLADFIGVGADGQALLIAGAILMLIAAAICGYMIKRKGESNDGANTKGLKQKPVITIFVLTALGLIVSRYGFYMASFL